MKPEYGIVQKTVKLLRACGYSEKVIENVLKIYLN